jgi:hypothetical protein
MLIFDRRILPEHRPWCFATAGMTVAALLWWGWDCWRTGQCPGGSSLPGFVFGVAGGLIIVFESLLGIRKMFRSVRADPFRSNPWIKAIIWLCLSAVPLLMFCTGFPKSSVMLGSILVVAFLMQFGAKHWMKAHIWLGLLSVALLILHSGFHFWNLALSGVLMAVFLIVIASGFWGLALQQTIPATMLREVSDEQIHSQIDRWLEHDLGEAQRLVDDISDLEGPPVPGSVSIRQFFKQYVVPFFEKKNMDRLPLASSERSAALFHKLRATLIDPSALEVVTKLEELCNRRRQLAKQSRLHTWLHGWLCVHLPLSVALLILLVCHVYYALRYF